MGTRGNLLDARQIVELLSLSPHPKEGGWFVETYRSVETIRGEHLPGRYGDQSVATAIYYLLTPQTRSELHRLASDEVFHFYLGDPVRMLNLHPDGSADVVTLGPDIVAGQRVQHIVPRWTWQGACLVEGGRWALLGRTVAPGFDWLDYESGNRDELIARYPEHRELTLRPAGGQRT